jgi:hypothetical protein
MGKIRVVATPIQKPGPTLGRSVPYYGEDGGRGGTGGAKSACLCLNRNYYSFKCCGKHLMSQGVGLVYKTQPPTE